MNKTTWCWLYAGAGEKAGGAGEGLEGFILEHGLDGRAGLDECIHVER